MFYALATSSAARWKRSPLNPAARRTIVRRTSSCATNREDTGEVLREKDKRGKEKAAGIWRREGDSTLGRGVSPYNGLAILFGNSARRINYLQACSRPKGLPYDPSSQLQDITQDRNRKRKFRAAQNRSCRSQAFQACVRAAVTRQLAEDTDRSE
jgi:hypothetical protein